MQIIEDGYGGNDDPVFTIGEDQEVRINTDELDNGAVVVNFDVYDHQEDQVVAQSGYVHVIQENEHFVVIVFDADGDVVSETKLPINFKEY